MTVVGETYVRVRPDVAGFGATLSTQVDAASRRAGVGAGKEAGIGFGQAFKGALAGSAAFVGIRGVFDAVKESIGSAAEESGQLALLAKAAENAHAATSLYGESLEELVRKQSLASGISEDELYPSFSRLLTATHDTAKAYRDLGLAEDVARRYHSSTTVAALALAKAEQGSVTSLQRLGIILPQNVLHLKGAEKATAALAEVQDRFGGSAEAFAQTGAGALQRFDASVHEISETIGYALLPQVQSAATGVAKWTSNTENLDRLQGRVATATHVIGDGAHAIGAGFDVAGQAVGPFVDAVGGAEKAAELVFGAVALRKVQLLALGVAKWGTATAAAETEVAAATAAEATATTAATAASTRQVAVYGARAEVLSTVAVAETEAAVATEAGAVASGGAATGFARLGVTGAGLGGVLRSGVAPAAVLAGYELSTFVRKIPGWNSEFESFGSHAEKLAEKLGLVGGGISKASTQAAAQLSDLDVQDKLIAAYKTALDQTQNVNDPGLRKQLEDKIVASILGPGFTFHDAQVFASNQQNFQRGQAGAATRQNYNPADAAAASPAATPDLDYRIRLQEALATKTTADEREIYANQLKYVDARIAALKAQGDLTAGEKKRLLERENEQAALQSAITQIQQDAADQAKQAADEQRAAADKARQAYTDSLSIQEQLLQIDASRAALTVANLNDDKTAAAKILAFYKVEANDSRLTAAQRAQYEQQYLTAEGAALQAAKSAYRDHLSLEEQRLQLGAQRAQLTEKSLADDKKAARKLIAFYTRESHDAKLTEQERLQFASQAINERIALKNLSGQQGGATAQQVFAEASTEFKTYGSNIATRSGILSGQDARASLGAHILSMRGSADLAAQIAARQRSAQLTEAQRQTSIATESRDLLRTIAGKNRSGIPPDNMAVQARRMAYLGHH